MTISLTQAAVFFTLALGSLASPVITHIGGGLGQGHATFHQVPNPNHKFIAPLSVKKAYLKYGAEVPDWLEQAVINHSSNTTIQTRATGAATTYPIDSFDSAYITPVQIGTPAQNFYLDFDTGSSDLWVYSTGTPAAQVNGQHIYSPAKSTTAKLLPGQSWSVQYGDGSTSSGNVYSDTVTVGGLAVKNQAVEAATSVSASFTQQTAIDGLMGLAFSTLNTVKPTQQSTFFDNAKASLTSPVFTADLKYRAPGTFTFGKIDTTAYKGAITYTPVNTAYGYWWWTSTGFAIGAGSWVAGNIDGIADTGTTLIYLPDAIVQAYYAQISGGQNNPAFGGWTFNCAAMAPAFIYGVGAARIVIPGSYMNFGAVTSDGKTCFGGLQSSAAIGVNIWGDVALKAAFVVFDGSSTPRLGFASK